MRQTVEEAILGKAPDVTAVEVEGMAENHPQTGKRTGAGRPADGMSPENP